MTSESGDICLQSWMKLTLFTFHVIFGSILQNALISTTNSFANISAQGYQILALFISTDRATCQLTKKAVIASSGILCLFSCFFLRCPYFPEIDTKKCIISNWKYKIKILRKNMSAKPRFYQSSTFQQVVCQSNHPGSCREQNCVILMCPLPLFCYCRHPIIFMFTLRQTEILQSGLEIYNPKWFNPL